MHPRAAAPGDRHTAHAGVFSRRCFAGPRDTRLHTRGEKQELAFRNRPRGDGVGGNINMKRPQLKPTGLRHYPHGACRSTGFKMKSQVCRKACAWDGARMAHRHDDGTIAC
jgi:hypothetical protein